MSEFCKPEYLAKAKLLTKEESERMLSRMQGKLPRRLQKDRISKEEALAIQMELEDEQLQHWRNMIRILREKEKAKEEAKTKKEAKARKAEKVKAAKKGKAPPEAKVTEKSKTPLKGQGRSKSQDRASQIAECPLHRTTCETDISLFQGNSVEFLPQFLTSLAVGLLIGLQRERTPSAKAGSAHLHR